MTNEAGDVREGQRVAKGTPTGALNPQGLQPPPGWSAQSSPPLSSQGCFQGCGQGVGPRGPPGGTRLPGQQHLVDQMTTRTQG